MQPTLSSDLTVEDATVFQLSIVICCGVGSVIAAIACTAFMLHILYHQRYKHEDRPRGSPSVSNATIVANSMVVLYLSTAIITCIFYGFVRSNMFTFIPLSAFTHYQCAFGYSGGFFFASFNRICLYFLLLYRIKSVFEGSAYQYSAKTFKYLTIILVVGYSLIVAVALAMFSQSNGFTLFHDETTGFIWCGHQGYHSEGWVRWTLIAWSICVLSAETVVNLMFLCMFSHGLYKLQGSILTRHKSLMDARNVELAPEQTAETKSGDLDVDRDDLVPQTSDNLAVQSSDNLTVQTSDNVEDSVPSPDSRENSHEQQRQRQKRVASNSSMKSARERYLSARNSTIGTLHSSSFDGSFHDMISRYAENKRKSHQEFHASVSMMIKLHQLAKKTTILVWIGVLWNLLYWITSVIDGWYAILVSWNILINAVCGWLMLKSSVKYWNCCAKYGVCRCCYKELDDDLL